MRTPREVFLFRWRINLVNNDCNIGKIMKSALGKNEFLSQSNKQKEMLSVVLSET